jgi:hypothetical protein
VIDAVRFGTQRQGISSGRWPDGAPRIRELAVPTPGAANSAPLEHDIIINEIMYHPLSGLAQDEYLELYNRGTNAVDVGNWRFVDGISFVIPPGTVIPADGYLVVARDRTHLLSKYPQLTPGNTVGITRESCRIAASGSPWCARMIRNFPRGDFVLVDEVTYSDGWGHWTDGGGSSLELVDPRATTIWAELGRQDETRKRPGPTSNTPGD